MRLIYIFDSYCIWCYTFSTVFKDLFEQYKDSIEIEVVNGGMILPDQPVHISVLAPAFKEISDIADNTFGKKVLGNDFLWHINHADQSDWFPNSEHPARAIIAFKELRPQYIGDIIHDVQYGLFEEGRDLTDDQAYLHILEKYEIDPDEFYEVMYSDKTAQMIEHEFSLTKRLQISVFPTILLQVNIDKFYIVSQGYESTDKVTARINDLLAEINN